ncbi:DNA-binding transcriptional regulator, LysR family [Variovorax sp. PDC80]|uniref:LysR family transcriptional regulator n=1 Tax=Variovorax sp. PDC80 TaxID=1882827 RepID=UPI0008E4BA92|nr:LysR family transcriptional regulator [Variovorax sp. PDC80]SFP70777.1 DNA-binding transcriptional regulator, LysR family [Variovorax sp. PDC80]
MRQDLLDGLVAFIVAAEERGFSAAAVRLGVTPSAVSQSIRSLERRLGIALFNRTTRSVSLTEVGERYLEKVRPVVSELAAVSEELGREADHPSGLLRLNVPRAGYTIGLQPVLRRFLDRFPDVKLELRIENQLVDIVAQGFDAGIRFGDLVEKDMIAVRIGPRIEAHLIASPDYLARHGTPAHPTELLAHDCIGFRHVSTGQVERWQFARGDETLQLAIDGRLVLNDSAALVRAALDGIGVAYMINGYIEPLIEQGLLVRLLADWSPVLPGLTLYYPDRRRVPAKLRALIDFLRAELPAASAVPPPELRLA